MENNSLFEEKKIIRNAISSYIKNLVIGSLIAISIGLIIYLVTVAFS